MIGFPSISGIGVVVTVCLLIVITWIISNFFSQRNKFIRFGKRVPGSMGWPIIGHMPYLKLSNIYPFIEYQTKKYGPIFRIMLGSHECVMINDFNLIKKAFSSQDFISRPNFLMMELNTMDGHGLVFSKEEIWHEQRRFAVSQLRRLGMGKSSMEATVHEEINAIFTEWKKTIGKPIDVNVSLNISITNIIWSIVTGQRMEYNDPKFIKLVGEVNKRIELGSTMSPIPFIPWMLRVLPKRFFNLDNFNEALKSFNKFAQEIIDGHKQAIDYEDPKDFVDHFLVKQKKEENNPETTFTNTQLLVTISDLFGAGGETTSATLGWAILLISRYPVVQKRVQDEIDHIIRADRYPTFSDWDRMPYTVAVIYEVIRFADLGPLAYHASSKDTTFEGYHIPKNAAVIGTLGCVHRNPKYWTKPYEFYPEHFLDAEGRVKRKIEGYFPFSTGKRSCIGEDIARIELFDFIVSFFQHFNMRLADSPTPSLEADPKSGIIRWPSPYKVIMEERHYR